MKQTVRDILIYIGSAIFCVLAIIAAVLEAAGTGSLGLCIAIAVVAIVLLILQGINLINIYSNKSSEAPSGDLDGDRLASTSNPYYDPVVEACAACEIPPSTSHYLSLRGDIIFQESPVYEEWVDMYIPSGTNVLEDEGSDNTYSVFCPMIFKDKKEAEIFLKGCKAITKKIEKKRAEEAAAAAVDPASVGNSDTSTAGDK